MADMVQHTTRTIEVWTTKHVQVQIEGKSCSMQFKDPQGNKQQIVVPIAVAAELYACLMKGTSVPGFVVPEEPVVSPLVKVGVA